MDRTERHDLKHDKFVEQTWSLYEWVETHPKPLLGGMIAIVAVVLAAWGISEYMQSRGRASADLLSQGQAALMAPVTTEQPAKPNDPYRPIFANDQQRAKEAAQRLEKAAGSGTRGAMAQYLRGVALLQAGDAKAAVTALQEAENRLDSDPTLGTSVKAAHAEALEASGQADKAAEAWRALSATDSGFPTDVALTGLGRALAKAGKKDEARTALNRVVTEFPQSAAAENAQRVLASL